MKPTRFELAAFALFVIAIAIHCTGCAAVQYRTLDAASQFVGEVAKGYPVIDAAQEAKIVAEAKSIHEGRTALNAWRMKSDLIMSTIDAAHASISYAKNGSTAEVAKVAIDAANILRALLIQHGIKIPGVL